MRYRFILRVMLATLNLYLSTILAVGTNKAKELGMKKWYLALYGVMFLCVASWGYLTYEFTLSYHRAFAARRFVL